MDQVFMIWIVWSFIITEINKIFQQCKTVNSVFVSHFFHKFSEVTNENCQFYYWGFFWFVKASLKFSLNHVDY